MLTKLNMINNILNSLPKEKFTIAFFIAQNSIAQDEWLNPLAGYLRKKGFFTLAITTPENYDKCNLSNAELQCILNINEISKLEHINVFIISDLDYAVQYPKNSKILSCCHALTPSENNPLSYQTYTGSTVDGYMISFPISTVCKEMITSLWDGLINKDISCRKDNFFHIIPTGYPRLHILTKELSLLNKKLDSILYAPVGIISYQTHGGERLKIHGKRILRNLLTSFPEMNIIFRPYKNDWDAPVVKEIESYFKNEQHFIIDKNTSRVESFSRSALCITDYSHIAHSFSFATLRPSIKFRPWENDVARNDETGTLVYDYTKLIKTCENNLLHLGRWEKTIERQRHKLLAPFESSFEEIADWIVDFYNGKPRGNWVSIKRYDQNDMPTEIELIYKFLEQATDSIPVLSATSAIYSYHNSPLLLAFALHSGYIFRPNDVVTFCGQLRSRIHKVQKGFNFLAWKFSANPIQQI